MKIQVLDYVLFVFVHANKSIYITSIVSQWQRDTLFDLGNFLTYVTYVFIFKK